MRARGFLALELAGVLAVVIGVAFLVCWPVAVVVAGAAAVTAAEVHG